MSGKADEHAQVSRHVLERNRRLAERLRESPNDGSWLGADYSRAAAAMVVKNPQNAAKHHCFLMWFAYRPRPV